MKHSTLIQALEVTPSPSPPSSTVEEPQETYDGDSELSPAEQSMAEVIAEEGLAIQHRFRPEPHFKQTGKGHYESRTVEDIRKARKKTEDSE